MRLTLLAGIQALIGMWSLGRLLALRLPRLGWSLLGLGLSIGPFVDAVQSLGPWLWLGILFATLNVAAWFVEPLVGTRTGNQHLNLAVGTLSWSSMWFYGALLSMTSHLTIEAGLWVRAHWGFRGSLILHLLHANDALTGALTGAFLAWAFGTRRALLLIPVPLALRVYIAYAGRLAWGSSFPLHQPAWFFPAPLGALAGVLLWIVVSARVTLNPDPGQVGS